MGHGVLLLPNVEKRWCLGPFAVYSLPATPQSGGSVCVSVRRDYGWPIGENDGAQWSSRIRWAQAHKGRKRHILVDTLGMLIARRVEPFRVPAPDDILIQNPTVCQKVFSFVRASAAVSSERVTTS